jgi:hypothetical protein
VETIDRRLEGQSAGYKKFCVSYAMRHKQAWSNPQTGCSASCVMGSQHKGSQRHQGVPKVQGKVTARLGSGQACKPVIRDVWALAPRRRGHSCVDQPRPCGFGTLLVTAAVLIGAYDVVVVIQVVLGGLAAPRAGGSAGSAVPCFGLGFGCRPGPCCGPSSSCLSKPTVVEIACSSSAGPGPACDCDESVR